MTNPNAEYYGLPPSQVAREIILTKFALTGYIRSYFENDALPGSTFSTDQTLQPEQREEIRREFNRLHQGYRKAFRVAILEGGTKLDRLSHNLKDLLPVELYRMIREEILAAYGVPHVVVGILDDASYANAGVQKQVFWENCLIPYIKQIEDTLNKIFTPRFGDNLKIKFDTSDVKALQEDDLVKADRVTKLVGRVITVNEARAEYGLEPLEGEDELRRPAPMLAPPDINDQGPDETPDTEDEEDDGKGLIVRIGKLSPKRMEKENQWRQHYGYVKSVEDQFATLMRRFFDGQLDRVLEKLRNIADGTGDFNPALMFAAMHRKVDSDDADGIFSIENENLLLEGAAGPRMKREVRRSGQAALNELGVSMQFNVTAPEVMLAIEQAKNRIVNVNNTSYQEIKDLLRQAYKEGWGVDKTAREIRGLYKEFNTVRSVRIAQTEMNGIVNGGHFLGYGQGGAESKSWMSAQLSTSRPWHIEAEAGNGVIPIKQKFSVGDSLMMYPSDPAGLVVDIVNCHCSILAS